MRTLTIIFLSVLSIKALSQPLHIRKATGPITVDAKMDEGDWALAEKAEAFQQYFPTDTLPSKLRTEVWMTYDDRHIYVFAKMYNLGPRTRKQYVTPSLRRDFRGEANDGITVVFDTFKDKMNAFVFGLNPFGVQREALIINGGNEREDVQLFWDNKWTGKVEMQDSLWVAEMAIPFKTIRFKEGLSSWNINFYRFDSHYSERSSWGHIKRNFNISSLAFPRELIWDEPLQHPGANVSLIPYAAARVNKNFEAGTPRNQEGDIGLDAKIGLGPGMNLDMTINPDFSQVDVDQQVTNLDRFEIYFPERRQFFLENGDLFSEFGMDNIRPFFSRRIGLAYDSVNKLYVSNPILFGAKLSGKINNNFRMGFLDAQTAQDRSINLPSGNFSVLALQHKVFARSSIGFIFVNKQATQDSIGKKFTFSPAHYNRVIGLDYNLASNNNQWNGKFFYHRSIDTHKTDSSFSMGMRLLYKTLPWDVLITAANVGAGYEPEGGFARRIDFQRLAHTTYKNFYPYSNTIQSHAVGFDFDVIGNQQFGITDWDINLLYKIKFKNTASCTLRLRKEYVYLFADVDPTRTGGPVLPAGSSFKNNVVVASFISDTRKKFNVELNTRSGGFYNGMRLNLGGKLNYRYQPYGSITMDFSYNHVELPLPYLDADLFLIGPQMDLTFTRNLYWTTYVQYNSQIKNLNINSRLQWRFKPVSDLFIVYTDNYWAESYRNGEFVFLDPGRPKTRAIVLKLTYWLNM